MNLSIDIRSNLHSYEMDVSLKTHSKRIGILGKSGAGKSMLLKYISGIISPDSGVIKVDDDVIFDSQKRIDVPPQKRNIAYMFQNYALFPNMNVEENIEIVVEGTKEYRKKKAVEYMEKFQIRDLSRKYPNELSGGQQQRVALARIMAYEPKLILLDEPFSAMDNDLKELLQNELEDMLEGFDGMIIMVSHSREEIYRFSDELVIIEDGVVVEHGYTKEIFKNPNTLIGSKIIGVSNVFEAKEVSDGIYIPDLDIKIDHDEDVYKKNPDRSKIKYIGIRDRDFRILSDGNGDKGIKVEVERIYEGIEETSIFFNVKKISKNCNEKDGLNYVYCIKINKDSEVKNLIKTGHLRILFDKERLIYIRE